MTLDDDPRALLQQASLHESSGRLTDAIAAYERLLRQWPALPNSWYNLARLQRRAGHFDAALASYREALNRGVTQPEEVHLNLGVIYSDCLRRADDAERELGIALALNPSYVPALLNLANLNEDRGRRDQARALYERLLALDPACHEALARYARLRGVSGPDDPLLSRLKQAIDSAGTTAQDKASLGFALGQLLDAIQSYDAAFAACLEANAHSRASVNAPGPLYDRAQHAQTIDQIIAAFPAARIEAVARGPTPPIFICGMFRSGSTLAEQVLASHTRVRAGGEISFIPNLVQTRLAPYPASLSSVSKQDLAEIAEQYRSTLAELAQGAPHLTDKRPDNFLHIGLIKTLFPDAKIVHTTRNPLDNALSIFFLHLEPSMAYALDLGDISHYYREYRRLMAHWKALYGADILDFDYDALVREPRPAVERLLDFCGLDWEEACMSFDRVNNSVRTASVWQVRQPLYRHASGRWKNYERHLAPLRDMLGDSAVLGA
ncbi:MAG: sulfotransferase [Rubrivivax sp.]|nr:sulfotransferase [Rubrivivax sp.]